VNEEYIYIRKQ